MKTKLLIGIMLLGLVSACSKSDSKNEGKPVKASRTESGAIEDFERAHLAGEINGQAWTQVSGRVTAPDNEGNSYLTLWDVNIKEPCHPVKVGNRSVVAKVALKPSRIELTDKKTISFSLYDGQMVRSTEVKNGVLKITKVEDGMLHGAILATHDETNHLEGSFSVKICE